MMSNVFKLITTRASNTHGLTRFSSNSNISNSKSYCCSRNGSILRHIHTSNEGVNVHTQKIWNIYLSGEIHTNWRDEIAAGVLENNLPIRLSYPVTNHADSDDCGAFILGMTEQRVHWDMMGAKMNAIRTQTAIRDADIVVVKFGEQYRQWNAAYDAGFAAAMGKSIITLHPPSLSHMLKEVNASANSVCTNTEQVIQTLKYVITGILPPSPKDGSSYVPIADRLGKGNPNP